MSEKIFTAIEVMLCDLNDLAAEPSEMSGWAYQTVKGILSKTKQIKRELTSQRPQEAKDDRQTNLP